ncbi:bifunctional serine/threonine-protein kinase/ABC transporter substrate-binding protein [Nocardia sp. CDC153]|uniref:bifunctional serine/threonine-protein kinase/ABC transporter substrate-binding protein n=1 Tax=Nocardia sp. CDC153 TaxID=3112167 RepID=UPI002DBF1A1F|nr:bifunctional serine/threonine-protein kinase/ABC transporter substrate-binding protein [Nocardia sp. CDC153]MEC3957379.1 bifunctional serine/threonine-protein kinase/ABC transporter substrate-binding protein [Nocardia sp. CDC153]
MVRAGEEFAGFLIERRLGGGGMGEVFLARHPRLPRLVAIKVLARELVSQAETRARFEREGELIARLDHPNIVTVHDRGVEDGRLWIAMQYVDGGDAATLDPFTLPPADAVHIIAETAKALDYAHVRGVIHRDVKPANILLTRPLLGQERRIVLTDFGIGRLRDDSAQITRSGVLATTITYASPEQLSGAAPDYRSDQYSLACTLFRLLTGATPFHADTVAAVVTGHLQHPVPKVSDRRPELPAALDAVLARGLAKRPEDRFESCRAFADAAAQALSAVSESTVTPIPEVSAALAEATRVVTAAGDVIGGPAAATSVLATLPAPSDPTVSDATWLQGNSPSKPRRARWVAAGAAALAVVVTAAVGILWTTKDHGPVVRSDPAIVVAGPQAGVYPGFGPFLQIDAQGRRIPAPTSVEDPANDGRLPCAPVSIAAALPLSGKNSDLGESLLGAVKLAVSQFVQGGNQVCPVTVEEFDTGGDQAKAAQTAQRIAADKSIVAVIGPAMSPEVMGAGQTLEDSGLPFLSPVATNPVLAQSGWSGFFRGLANDNAQGPALGRYLATTAAFSRVCALRDTGGGYEGPLSTAVVDGLGPAAVPECKLSIDMGGDLTDTIATIAAARPDAVFYAGYPKDAAALLAKLRSAGVTATFVLGDGSFDPLFRDTAGALAAGTLVTCGCGPATDRLLADYRTATGKSATANIVEAYDLTAIVLRGIVSGHTKRADLREYLHAYHADGIAHSYAWTAAGEPADPRIWLYRLS